MAATVVLTIVFLAGGFAVATLWATLLRTVAEPCAILYDWGRRHNRPLLSMAAFLAALSVQVYGALTFVALVISLTRYFLSTRSDLLAWPFWVAAYFVAVMPGFLLVNSASRTERPHAIKMIPMAVLPLAMFAFFPLVCRNEFLQAGWWWIPYVRT